MDSISSEKSLLEIRAALNVQVNEAICPACESGYHGEHAQLEVFRCSCPCHARGL